jgi:hypothetical protein
MPTEAKLGLLLGIGLTITLAVLLRPREQSLTARPVATPIQQSAAELQGQTTSQRK